MTTPADIDDIAPSRLRDIFGADAALYIDIKQYGASYIVINSVTVVAAEAKLLDLRTSKILWTGSASASSEDGKNTSGGLAGLLISAIVNQIVATAADASYDMAGVTSIRLLMSGWPDGILHGPRSPKYQSAH